MSTGITTERNREQRARDKARRQGLSLRKSRTNGSVYLRGVYQGENIDDRGGWRILSHETGSHDGIIVAGEKFDLSLDGVEDFLAEG
jgi:hypothetical protein